MNQKEVFLDYIVEKERKRINIVFGERKENKISIIIHTQKKEKKYFRKIYTKITNKKREIEKRWKEKKQEKKNKPHQYTSILEQIVEMKNSGKNYQEIQEKYQGFKKKETLTQAFKDYQNNYQQRKFTKKIRKFDNKIATEEYKRKISYLYQHSQKNLKEIAKDLGTEYGMNISTSTISRYARKKLGVQNRKEARKE